MVVTSSKKRTAWNKGMKSPGTGYKPDPKRIYRSMQIRELTKEGLSAREIAEKLGCGRGAVTRTWMEDRAAGIVYQTDARAKDRMSEGGKKRAAQVSAERVRTKAEKPASTWEPGKKTGPVHVRYDDNTPEGAVNLMERTGCCWPYQPADETLYCNKPRARVQRFEGITETSPYCATHVEMRRASKFTRIVGVER